MSAPQEGWSRLDSPRLMMATTATHQLGDISRDQPDLAVIYGEDGDGWVGMWNYGFGFAGVRFPKATTRELTAEERERFGLDDEDCP